MRELISASEKIMKLEQENSELRKQLIEFGSKLEKHQTLIERAFKPDRKKRRKKPGARPGHKAHHRPKPEEIDEVVEVDECPHCGTKVNGGDIRPRIVWHIVPSEPVVKQYNIHRAGVPGAGGWSTPSQLRSYLTCALDLTWVCWWRSSPMP